MNWCINRCKFKVLVLELISKINSFSHNGYRSIWRPVYTTKDSNYLFVNCRGLAQSNDLIMCLQLIFGISNHNRDRGKLWKKFYGDEDEYVLQTCIEFSTNKDNYKLVRIFRGKEPVESRLHSENLNIVYHGSEAVSKIAKMIRPIIVPEGHHKMSHRVFETDCEQTNRTMSELVKFWSESSGIDIEKTYQGARKLPYYMWRRKYDNEHSSIITFLSTLARAAVRTRKHGYCPSLICYVEVNILNDFEIKTLIDLTSKICEIERLDVLVITSRFEEIACGFTKNLTLLDY